MFREIAEASKLQCNFLIKGTYVITDGCGTILMQKLTRLEIHILLHT
jgi:hypothetical protein